MFINILNNPGKVNTLPLTTEFISKMMLNAWLITDSLPRCLNFMDVTGACGNIGIPLNHLVYKIHAGMSVTAGR